MKKILLLFIFLSVLSSCRNKNSYTYNYPKVIDINIGTKKINDIDYNVYFESLENDSLPAKIKWDSIQKELSNNYFKRNNLESEIERINKLNQHQKSNLYWYRPFNDTESFICEDTDTEMKIYHYDGQKLQKEVLSIPFDETIYEFHTNQDGSILLLGVVSDNGHHLALYTKTGKLIHKIEKDINLEYYFQSAFIGLNTISYICYPNEDNSNSYISSYNTKTEELNVIFSGKDILNYDNTKYLIPFSSSPNSKYLQSYVADAGQHFDLYIANKNGKQKNVWKKASSVKDSIIYFSVERNDTLFYRKIVNGKKVLVYKPLSKENKETPIFTPKENQSLGLLSVTSNNIYYSISNNDLTKELYETDISGNSKLVNLNYPIAGDISHYSGNTAMKKSTFHIQTWNKGDDVFTIDDKELNQVPISTTINPEFSNIIEDLIYITSHDGVKIPVTILKRNDFKNKNNSITIIHAYGAYGYQPTPYYITSLMDFINKGNIMLIPHIRGGGGLGNQWYSDGTKLLKQNSWKDIIATANYALESNISNAGKIGLIFDSAGGISNGMAVNENVNLFSGMVGISASLNPIRAHFAEGIIKTGWDYDFGNIDTKEGMKSLALMDPVSNYNIDNKNYPASLLIVGEQDNLVPNASSAKWTALSQRNNNSKAYIYDSSHDEGHSVDFTLAWNKAILFLNNELK